MSTNVCTSFIDVRQTWHRVTCLFIQFTKFYFIDSLVVGKMSTTTTMEKYLTIDSNPCYLAPSQSPSPFCDSGSGADDEYVNDGDDEYVNDDDDMDQHIKKVVPFSKANEYVESRSSYLEHEYEYMEKDNDEYEYI